MVAKTKKAPKEKKAKKGPSANGEKPPVTEREDLHQAFIPGAEPQEPIAEIDEAARFYMSAKKRAKEAKDERDECESALLAAMHDNDQTRYETGSGYVVTRDHNEKVKVKKKKEIKIG